MRDLRDLHARRWPELEARDHRARVHLDHLGLDAEVAQLELDEPRHRLERLGGIAAGARRRVVEQRQLGQLGGARRLEHRHLLFLLDPLALLDLGRRRLDLRRLALGGFLLLLPHHFLPRLLHLAAGLHVARGGDALAHPADAAQHAEADAVHHVDPRHAGEQGHRPEPDREQQQRRAEQAQHRGDAVAHQRAEHATGGIGQGAACEMQGGKAAASGEREHEAGAAQAERAAVDRLAAGPLAVQRPAGEAEHQREEERRAAEQHEEQVGEPRPERPDQVHDRPLLPGRGERRVVRVVGDQRDEQDQRQRAEHPQCALAQAACDQRRLSGCLVLRFGPSHSPSPESSKLSRKLMKLRRLPARWRYRHGSGAGELRRRAPRRFAVRRRVAYHAAPDPGRVAPERRKYT